MDTKKEAASTVLTRSKTKPAAGAGAGKPRGRPPAAGAGKPNGKQRAPGPGSPPLPITVSQPPPPGPGSPSPLSGPVSPLPGPAPVVPTKELVVSLKVTPTDQPNGYGYPISDYRINVSNVNLVDVATNVNSFVQKMVESLSDPMHKSKPNISKTFAVNETKMKFAPTSLIMPTVKVNGGNKNNIKTRKQKNNTRRNKKHKNKTQKSNKYVY